MKIQPFNQPPPTIGNQYDDDRVLRAYVERAFDGADRAAVVEELRAMGELASGELYQGFLADLFNEPVLTSWGPWGERIDRVDVPEHWLRSHRVAAEKGLVASGYESRFGALRRVHQFALVYLYAPSTHVYGCPLAMTDGATRTLLDSGNQKLIDRAVPRLTSRDVATFWTSGQWMTESTGGSDVGQSETVAVQDNGDQYRLYGRKWFTSAVTADMALALARPEGNGPGGNGLALFYVELRDDQGRLRNIYVNRLKDKLGTKHVPTAELTLDGAPATLVAETTGGVRNITPMLNITRTWNATTAVALMRRGIALARDYAQRRVAFGAPLSEKPLHLETLAGLQAELEAAFHLTFRVAELMGRSETGEIAANDEKLLRLLTPIMKLVTGKQAVAVTSEVLEAFGGAGYVEDTGLPVLLRDAQVLPIWEGTTNVLSLDTLRALNRTGGYEELRTEVEQIAAAVKDPALRQAGQVATAAVRHAGEWLGEASKRGLEVVEGGARGFAITLGRAYALARSIEAAQHALEHGGDTRPRAAAVRFARQSIDQVAPSDLDDAFALANDRVKQR